MPSSSAAVFGTAGSELEDPTSGVGVPSGPSHRSFEELWEEMESDLRNKKKAIEREERKAGNLYKFAYEIAFRFPEKVDIDRAPFGRNRDLNEHIQDHFDSLLNNDSGGGTLKSGPVPDYDNLLRAAELIYIDDAMFRFIEEIKFTPKEDGLAQVAFNGRPKGVNDSFIRDWHLEFDPVWEALIGNIRPGFRIDKKIDSLYERRKTFINHCRANNVYMPITIDASRDADSKRRNILKHLRRDSYVDPELVHEYCFLKTREY